MPTLTLLTLRCFMSLLSKPTILPMVRSDVAPTGFNLTLRPAVPTPQGEV